MTLTQTAPATEVVATEIDQESTDRHPKRWTTDEFMHLHEIGAFSEGSRIELIDGEFYEMASIGNPHYLCSMICRTLLTKSLGEDNYLIGQEVPITIPKLSEPQPDLSVVRGGIAEMKKRGRKPYPDEVALLIEVSDSTYKFDSTKKLSAYARAGIPEYWIVNLQKSEFEQHTAPVTVVEDGREVGQYKVKRTLRAGDTVESLELGSYEVAVVLDV